MDLLDALVVDSIYCLARIQEQIIPVQNSMVFNNSFKADVFYNQFRVAIIYQYLYCYYTFADTKKQAITSFLEQINGEDDTELKELPNGYERGKIYTVRCVSLHIIIIRIVLMLCIWEKAVFIIIQKRNRFICKEKFIRNS